MEFGDISNELYKSAWDFRLFISVWYPRLFKRCLTTKWLRWALPYTFDYCETMLEAFHKDLRYDNYVLITHKDLEILFKSREMKTMFIGNVTVLDRLSVEVLYTGDHVWSLATKKAVYVQKPVQRLQHKKGIRRQTLLYVERFLRNAEH